MTARRVLVIDSDPTVCRVIARSLEPLAFEIHHEREGHTGIEKARQIKPDLILLDLEMPDMTGQQICHYLGKTQDLQNIPVILMLTGETAVDETSMKTNKIVDFIRKPFSPETLSTSCQRAMEKHLAGQDPVDTQPLMPVSKSNQQDQPISEPSYERRARLAMRGNLEMVPAGEVLQLLKFKQHSGILRLTKGQVRLDVFLREGNITFARSHNADKEFLLGRFLVETGAIATQDLEMFMSCHHKGNQLLGEQLVKLGYVTKEQVLAALKRQTEELVYEVLRWNKGEFVFFVTDKLPKEAKKANLRLSVDHVLMEGFRRVYEWSTIEKEIQDFDEVFAPSQEAEDIMPSIKLEPEEKDILALLDGQRTVKEVIRLSQRSSFDVCRSLSRLLSYRLVFNRATPRRK